MDAQSSGSGDRLSRLGSAALVAGGASGAVLTVVLQLSNADTPPLSPIAVGARAMSALAGLLLILGLPVLAARLGRRSPALAVSGLVLTMVWILVYQVFLGVAQATLFPPNGTASAINGPSITPAIAVLLVGGLAQFFGGVLLGIAALRTHAVSRVAAGLLLASSVLFIGTFSRLPIFAWAGEWFDVASEVALLAGLTLAGLELLNVRLQRSVSLRRRGTQAQT
jgi:hypothetical protein